MKKPIISGPIILFGLGICLCFIGISQTPDKTLNDSVKAKEQEVVRIIKLMGERSPDLEAELEKANYSLQSDNNIVNNKLGIGFLFFFSGIIVFFATLLYYFLLRNKEKDSDTSYTPRKTIHWEW